MKPNLVVSVSGGRTSMFMAIWIWRNWQHLYNIIFIFANTGAEHEDTLRFVDECSRIFGFPITWVEAKVYEGRIGTSFKIVDFATASRNYEPFVEVIKKYGIPNHAYKHCNRELKLAPIHAYCTNLFGGKDYENYTTAIGIRVDEIDRINDKYIERNLTYPLIFNIPTSKSEIIAWWKNLPCDLQIPEHYGNCKVCFKKSDRKLATIALEKPEWFEPVINFENNYSHIKVKKDQPNRKMFRSHKSTADIFLISKDGNFKKFIDSEYDYSDNELDIEEACSLDCSPYDEVVG